MVNTLILLVTFTIMHLSGIGSIITVSPNDTLVIYGDSTQLNCSYVEERTLAAWYKGEPPNHIRLTLGRTSANPELYDIIGNEDMFEYNLRILNATAESNDLYECTDVDLPGNSETAYVYVIDGFPNCTVYPGQTLIQGDSVAFECSIGLDESAPGDLVLLQNGKEVSRNQAKHHKWETQLSSSDHNATFDCQLQHYTLPAWKWSEVSCQEKIRINVQYSPVVSPVYASQNPMREEADFRAECQVIDANPEEIVDEYWIGPDGKMISDNTSLLLKNVSREMSGEYTCVMSNVFYNGVMGNGTATVEVDVQYLSTVNMTVIPSLNVTAGDEVTIHCEALNGNPDPQRLELLHKGDTIDESDERKLQITISSVDGSQSGIYQCNAYTRFYDGVEHSTIMREIVVNFSPKIASEKTKFEANIGDTVPMPCKVHGFPRPSVSWFDDNDARIPGYEENKKITEEETDEENMFTSTMTVTVADESYYGRYTCKATNNIPPDDEQTMEIVKPNDSGSNSTIIAIAVTVASVVIVIIVIAIIFCCRRTVEKGVKGEKTNTGVGDGDQADLDPGHDKDRQEPDGGSQEFELSPCSEPAAISTKTLTEGERLSSDRNPSSMSPDGNQGDMKEEGLHPNPSALYAVPHKEKKTQHAGDISNVSGSDGKVTVTDQPSPKDITVSQKQSRTSKKERDPKGDLAYADLDLTGSGGPERQNKPSDIEKTQYATIMHAS